jgi:hypothetical protein
MAKVDVTKLSDAELKKMGTTRSELAEAMQLLEKKKERAAKIASGEIKGTTYKKRSEMTKEELAKVKAADAALLARNTIIMRKAKAQGITASDAEVKKYLDEKAGRQV